MKVLILSLVPILGFVIGAWVARNRGDARLRDDYNRVVRKLSLAEEVIDDLSFMAAEHGALGEPGGVLMGERISEYRKAKRNEG